MTEVDTPPTLPKARGLAVLSAMRASADPERFFSQCLTEQGDPFCVQLPGVGDIYMTSCPEGAKEIFSAKIDAFKPVLPNPIEPLLGPASLILLGGARHRRERKLLAPPFMGERMRAYAELICEVTQQQIQRYEPGNVLVAQELTQSITLRVIIRAIFGITDPARRELYAQCITDYSERYTPSLLVLPFMRHRMAGLSPWAKFADAYKRFDALLQEDIELRRESTHSERTDILSLLLDLRYDDGEGLSDTELKDELRTMLVAGHETTATALAWALFYLHHEPELVETLRQHIDALPDSGPAGLSGEPYLTAVCQEALRRHPVVPIVLRRVCKPFTLRGHTIEEGKAVGVAITLLHTHHGTWKNPLAFDPSHFIDRKYSPFEFAPFGGGARRCLGASFASFEMKLVLGTLIRDHRFELRTTEPPKPVTRSITMAPTDPIELLWGGIR